MAQPAGARCGRAVASAMRLRPARRLGMLLPWGMLGRALAGRKMGAGAAMMRMLRWTQRCGRRCLGLRH